VLGANDGLISTSSSVVGVAAAAVSSRGGVAHASAGLSPGAVGRRRIRVGQLAGRHRELDYERERRELETTRPSNTRNSPASTARAG
jgi:VIT1/CCC1 family predicted Fe2+/Mn2+ transporter